jgi:hypothetical protein
MQNIPTQPKPKKPRKKMGRPKIAIDYDLFDKLCSIQCTQEEIASIMNVSVDTLERRCRREKKQTFAEYYDKKRAGGKMSLRRKQYEIAQSGNVTMLIWLGKQYLGQSEKQDMDVNMTINSWDDLEKKLDEKENSKLARKAMDCAILIMESGTNRTAWK